MSVEGKAINAITNRKTGIIKIAIANYVLVSQEVESFILENRHLPEIPNAEQMEAEGVNLAEMNKLLLMKVEELTLYMIEQQKMINALQGAISKE